MRYWLFTEPTDMRKSFHMLSGIVNNQMSIDLRNGDVFIFINKNRNRIKLLRKEPGGLVIYAMMLDYGRLQRPLGHELENSTGYNPSTTSGARPVTLQISSIGYPKSFKALATLACSSTFPSAFPFASPSARPFSSPSRKPSSF